MGHNNPLRTRTGDDYTSGVVSAARRYYVIAERPSRSVVSARNIGTGGCAHLAGQRPARISHLSGHRPHR